MTATSSTRSTPTRVPAPAPAERDAPVTLAASYAANRRLNREHGTTYYWAAFVLPRPKRPHVWALYGFCRYADEIVDDAMGNGVVAPDASPAEAVAAREAALVAFGDRFFTDLERGRSDDPILAAVVHTVRAFGIDPDLFRRFLDSMAMDLTVTAYETYDDLCRYMDGSASVIGEMMLPILGPLPGFDLDAVGPARALGEAFQLTNFLRDVGEDLERGRVYLPQEDLRRFGADPWRRTVDDAWVDLARFEIERCRALYAEAERGEAMLPPASARCIRAARVLYGGILDVVEANGYDVFSQRARVPGWRKAAVVARSARPRSTRPEAV